MGQRLNNVTRAERESNLSNYTKKLSVGTLFRQYKDLCNFLHQEPLRGNARNSQMNEWSRFFDWEKDGQKYIIVDVYESPIPFVDGRVNNRGKYLDYIESVLLCCLYLHRCNNHNQNDYLEMTSKKLYVALGMVNESYENRPIDLTYQGQLIGDFDIRNFYRRTNQKLNYLLKSALEDLEKKSLIRYNKESKIRFLNKHSEKFEYRNATDADKEYILRTEREVLYSMKYESFVEIYVHNRGQEFMNKCKKYVQANFGWDSYYSYYKIIYDTEWADDMIDKLLQGKQSNMKTLNQTIISSLNQQAQSAFDKANKKIEDALPQLAAGEEVKGLFQYPADYVEVQAELADRLIKID